MFSFFAAQLNEVYRTEASVSWPLKVLGSATEWDFWDPASLSEHVY